MWMSRMKLPWLRVCSRVGGLRIFWVVREFEMVEGRRAKVDLRMIRRAMQTVDRQRLDAVVTIAGLNWSNQGNGIESKWISLLAEYWKET